MNDVERFQRLSAIYGDLSRTAFGNLTAIKGSQKKGLLTKVFAKPPLDQMKQFRLAPAGSCLSRSEGGESLSLILGEFDERMTFYPSITEKILKIHSVANLVNASLETRLLTSEQALVQPLQETLLDFCFLDKTFAFYASKAALIDGKVENMIQKKGEIEELLKTYYQSFVAGMNELIQSCIDLTHLNVKVKQYVFKPYAWMTQEVGVDGKVVNDYNLPREYWEPFLKYMTAEQAKAMRR
jgi:hypothetical protein